MSALPHRARPAAPDDEGPSGEDRDSLHTLAIRVLPIRTSIFRRARLVKNSRLESAVELFGGAGCGRGQVDVREVAKFLSLKDGAQHPDVKLLLAVGDL